MVVSMTLVIGLLSFCMTHILRGNKPEEHHQSLLEMDANGD